MVFPAAQPDDGQLEVGVVTADGLWEWVRVFVGLLRRKAERSTLVRTTRGTNVDVRLARHVAYEVDGGDRDPTNRLKLHVEPLAVTFRVP